MRRFVFIISLLFISLEVISQDLGYKVDTLYYNSDLKLEVIKDFVDYYKITYTPNDSNLTKRFCDYYVTGELKSQGNFIKINKFDDEKSVYDGKVINYYKSKAIKSELIYEDGILNGESKEYYENGLLKRKINYVNGNIHGTLYWFTEDGLACVEDRYDNGETVDEYYTLINMDGTSARYKHSDSSPYYDIPKLEDVVKQNGTYVIKANGIEYRVRFYYDDAWFKHYEIYMTIINNSANDVVFNPEESTLCEINEKTNEKINHDILLGVEVEDYIGRRKRAAASLLAITTSLQSSLSGTSTYRTTTNTNTTFNGVGNSRINYKDNAGYNSSTIIDSKVSGNINSNSVSTTTIIDQSKAFQNQMLANQAMSDVYSRIPEDAKKFTENYIERCVIKPGEAVSGKIWAECNGPFKANRRSYIFTSKLNNIEYSILHQKQKK